MEKFSMNTKKNKSGVLVGITGGIAAFKLAEVVSALVKKGIDVQVIMTENATQFIGEETFSALTGKRVYKDLFSSFSEGRILHVEFSGNYKIFLIAPATANIIGKIAHGIADDFITTTCLGFSPDNVVIAPAMNTRMYENPMVQENIRKLKDKGYKFIEPESGILACKEEGKGRLADWKVIVDYVEQLLEETKDYKGKKVLVSAGPTRESIDPVRFITNRSSGKMGYAIAKRARDRGADVILVSGPTSIEPPYGIDVIWVESAVDMYNEIVNQVTDVDIFISAAAVSDFRPADYVDKKIKKEAKDEVVLRLIRNPDILKEVSMKKKKEQIFVGFSAETHDLLENAKKKMNEKNLDLIVANKIGKKGSGFEADTNKISIIDREGNITVYPLLTKDKVADIILSKALEVIS